MWKNMTSMYPSCLLYKIYLWKTFSVRILEGNNKLVRHLTIHQRGFLDAKCVMAECFGRNRAIDLAR